MLAFASDVTGTCMNDDSATRNGVPVLERTMEMLSLLERDSDGMTIRAITAELGLPRSTVYRVLNTLLAHKLVRRNAAGAFALGPRLVSLAARVRSEAGSYDLGEIAMPLMRQMRDNLGEPVKLSIRDGDHAKVIVALLGQREYSPAPSTGTSYPLHAGAASKMILAHVAPDDLDRLLSAPLTRYTPRTITAPERLRADLARVRRQNFAQDMGEHNITVHAIATPVFDAAGKFLAALSIPFLADKDAFEREQMRSALIATAAQISARVPKG